MSARPIVLVANARLPSQRAQSLQVVQAAAAFARAGRRATLCYARRSDTPAVEHSDELCAYYGVPAGPRPELAAVPCLDWIDRVPRRLQYLPARLQELSFARNAARCVRREHPEALVLSRELETARGLVRSRHDGVCLELHRVPGGGLRRRWLREAASGARGIVAISGGVKEDLVRLGLDPAKILVEHDAFELGRFAGLPSRADARAALGLDAERPVVVYTGGLLVWKGVDLLVEVAARLGEVQFVVAGGMDADVDLLRRKASGLANLRIDGFQPPERVPLYLVAADLGVVPNRSTPPISARYTSPLKVFEAMAVGLPLVVSDLFSLRDVLGEDEAVFVRPDDAGDLARGLEELLGDEARQTRLAAALRARAAEHTWDARAERLLAWMEQRS